MKKYLQLTIICHLIIISCTNAQKIIVGAKGGINFSKIDARSFNSNYNVGFQIGGYAEFKLKNKWGLQTELVYNQNNEKLNTTGFEQVYENANTIGENPIANMGNITVPLLVTYKINNLFSVMAGPQLGLMVL